MKKIVLSFALCLMSLGVYADGSVSMGTAQVKQGKTALVEVNYEITSGSYSAVELYFSMPEGVEVVTTDEDASGAVVKATGENSGMQFILKKSSLFTGAYASNSYVLLGYSGNLTSSGTLCSITIRAAATTGIADYNAILNDNSEACVAGHACFDTPNKFDLTTSVPFTVSVVADVLDLYDNLTTAPAATTDNENVKLHRSFNADQWYSLILPFDVSDADVQSVFGGAAQVVEFTDWMGASIPTNTDENNVEVILTTVSGITANTPCLIKPSVAVTDPVFNNVPAFTPAAADELSVDIEKNNGKTGKNKVVYGTSSMFGTYVQTTVAPDADNNVYPLFLSENNLYYATSAKTLKGYRAWFEMWDNPLYDNAPVKMLIDQDPTAITSIDAEYENGMVYTIDGKFVGKNVNLNRMQKGVYIVNGKKFINK